MAANNALQPFGGLLNYAVMPAAGLLALVFGLCVASPAGAQTLGSGDYEICSVIDRGGDFRGYDRVCLESRRAELRHLRRLAWRDRSELPGGYGPHYCPSTANQGRGWSVGGVNSYGPATPGSSGYTTMDRPVNGRLCVPRPVGYLSYGWD